MLFLKQGFYFCFYQVADFAKFCQISSSEPSTAAMNQEIGSRIPNC